MDSHKVGSQVTFDADFQEQTERELQRLEATLHDLDAELAELQRERNRVAEMVGHLQGLQGLLHLEDNQTSPEDPHTHPTPPQSRRAADADLVVEYLEETGTPTHYREIYQALAERGLTVGGKDPANTLLSRYFNDPRLTRVKRGTYALKD